MLHLLHALPNEYIHSTLTFSHRFTFFFLSLSLSHTHFFCLSFLSFCLSRMKGEFNFKLETPNLICTFLKLLETRAFVVANVNFKTRASENILTLVFSFDSRKLSRIACWKKKDFPAFFQLLEKYFYISLLIEEKK